MWCQTRKTLLEELLRTVVRSCRRRIVFADRGSEEVSIDAGNEPRCATAVAVVCLAKL